MVGIFSNSIITNFLLILTVTNFGNRLIFGKVTVYKIVPIFGPPCVHKCFEQTTPGDDGTKFTDLVLLKSIRHQ